MTSLLQSGVNKPRKGADAGDHPPITPMRSASAELQGDALRIYNYIVSHFIATVSRTPYLSVSTEKISMNFVRHRKMFLFIFVNWIHTQGTYFGLTVISECCEGPSCLFKALICCFMSTFIHY